MIMSKSVYFNLDDLTKILESYIFNRYCTQDCEKEYVSCYDMIEHIRTMKQQCLDNPKCCDKLCKIIDEKDDAN